MSDRRRSASTAHKGNDAGWAALAVMSTVLTVATVGWGALHLAAWSTNTDAPPTNPSRLVDGLMHHTVHWSQAATLWAVGLAAVPIILGAVIAWAIARTLRRRKRSDHAAKFMAGGRDTAHLRAAGASKKAARLAPTVKAPGLAFGINVRDRRTVYASWEDMGVLVAGPRTQKSVAYAIPTVLAAPGLVFTTANKPDVHAATIGIRSQMGRTWTFDPQDITKSECSMWWNPLTYIAPIDPATGRARRDRWGQVEADETRAKKLAKQFVTSTSDGISNGGNDYFEKRGASLIGLLLLAAACGEQPITKVHSWLTDPGEDDPNVYLDAAGFDPQSASLRALRNMTDKQQQGVYDGALETMAFLEVRKYQKWITMPMDGSGREQLNHNQLATSTDTLYLLSDDDDSGAGPLVAALTVALVDALVDAARDAGGRLPVPAVGVLDEAANICKFRRLDSLYSYFGSMGIVLWTILQSPTQAEEVWGEKGWRKLWSASNVKIYGGGVSDVPFLQNISTLVGSRKELVMSISRGKHGRSTSYDTRDETILSVADLGELEAGRAIAFVSGTPAMLIEPVPWFESKRAKEITAAMAES